MTMVDIRYRDVTSGAISGAEAEERAARSSDITLEATTTRRPAVPSLLVSSATAAPLISGATQVGNFIWNKSRDCKHHTKCMEKFTILPIIGFTNGHKDFRSFTTRKYFGAIGILFSSAEIYDPICIPRVE